MNQVPKQRLALMGSTGSIGRQTLDIVRNRPDEFEVTTLTAARSWQLLVEQAKEFQPDSVVIADKSLYNNVKEALAGEPIKVFAGDEALSQVVTGGEVDTVVNALVGYAGMLPSLSAGRAGKRLALANKESLVVAGELIMREAAQRNVPILPIDSEHSAIFQCLAGEVSPVRRVIITASGGPFLRTPAEELAGVTVEQAPTSSGGPAAARSRSPPRRASGPWSRSRRATTSTRRTTTRSGRSLTATSPCA